MRTVIINNFQLALCYSFIHAWQTRPVVCKHFHLAFSCEYSFFSSQKLKFIVKRRHWWGECLWKFFQRMIHKRQESALSTSPPRKLFYAGRKSKKLGCKVPQRVDCRVSAAFRRPSKRNQRMMDVAENHRFHESPRYDYPFYPSVCNGWSFLRM